MRYGDGKRHTSELVVSIYVTLFYHFFIFNLQLPGDRRREGVSGVR